MSILPPNQTSGLATLEEKMRWRYPKDLEGKIFDNIAELQENIPESAEYGKIFLKEDKDELQRYSRIRNTSDNEASYDIAYGCPSCEKIIIGPPRIEETNSIDDRHILSGREGYDMYCHNCDYHLKSKDYRVS